MTTETTEALRFGKALFTEVLEGLNEAAQINDLPDLMADAAAHKRVVGLQRAQRLGDGDAKIERATSAFAGTASRLLREYAREQIEPDDLRAQMRVAFIRQARYAYRAGKREMGNTARLTIEDEREIAEVVAAEGLTRGEPIPKGSIGGLVERVVNEPPLTPPQQRIVERIEETISDHVERSVTLAVGAAAGRATSAERQERVRSMTPQLVDQAKGRVEREVANIHKRVLRGSIVADAAAVFLVVLLGRELLRAFRRARSTAGNGTGPLTVAEQAELDTLQRFAEEETLAQVAPAGLNWGRLLILAVLARSALRNSNIDHWLRDRLGGVAGQLYRLLMGGEKAAFRDGITAPTPEDEGVLAGADTAAPVPSPLQRRALVYWLLGEAEHCIDCVRFADLSPYYLDVFVRNGIHPGSGHSRCRQNCRCHLEFDLPIFV